MAVTSLAGEFAEFLMVTLQIIKEAVSSFFVTLTSQKTSSHQWNLKNDGSILFNIIFLVL